MEKKVTTIQVPKEVVRYVAYDGIEFATEDACKKYEETAECAINAAVTKLQIAEATGGDVLDNCAPFACDSAMHAVEISDVHDLEVVNRWIVAINKRSDNCLGPEYIGEDVILEHYDGYVYVYGTIGEMVNNFEKWLKILFGRKDEKPEENS